MILLVFGKEIQRIAEQVLDGAKAGMEKRAAIEVSDMDQKSSAWLIFPIFPPACLWSFTLPKKSIRLLRW
jgi:hypothetical protein